MRAVAGFVLLAALLLPAADGRHGTSVEAFKVLLDDGPYRLAAGDVKRVTVEAAHRCPAWGDVDFRAEGPFGLELDVPDARWGDCTDEDYAFATTTLTIRANASVRAGVNPVGVFAIWNGEGAAEAVDVRVPLVASATLEGPREVAALAGRPAAVEMKITVEANGGVKVHLGHDADGGWTVQTPQFLDSPWEEGPRTLTWTARVTPPASAGGDRTLTFRVVPTASGESGRGDALPVTLRLPPAGAGAAPLDSGAAPPPAARADEAPPTEGAWTAVQERSGAAVPGWVVGAAIFVLGAAAFLWFLRG